MRILLPYNKYAAATMGQLVDKYPGASWTIFDYARVYSNPSGFEADEVIRPDKALSIGPALLARLAACRFDVLVMATDTVDAAPLHKIFGAALVPRRVAFYGVSEDRWVEKKILPHILFTALETVAGILLLPLCYAGVFIMSLKYRKAFAQKKDRTG